MAVTAAGAPREAPLGTRVHHLGSHARSAPEAVAAKIQIPRSWPTALQPNSQSWGPGLWSFFEDLPDTSGEQPGLGILVLPTQAQVRS